MPLQEGNGECTLMKNKLYVVGMGPGKEEMMTGEALSVLDQADVLIG